MHNVHLQGEGLALVGVLGAIRTGLPPVPVNLDHMVILRQGATSQYANWGSRILFDVNLLTDLFIECKNLSNKYKYTYSSFSSFVL